MMIGDDVWALCIARQFLNKKDRLSMRLVCRWARDVFTQDRVWNKAGIGKTHADFYHTIMNRSHRRYRKARSSLDDLCRKIRDTKAEGDFARRANLQERRSYWSYVLDELQSLLPGFIKEADEYKEAYRSFRELYNKERERETVRLAPLTD